MREFAAMVGRAHYLVPLILSVVLLFGARAPAAPDAAYSLSGQLLVATSSLDDPNFAHTVVYLIQHDQEGAIGLVINRVIATGPLSELLEGFGMAPDNGTQAQIRVHYGGPVEQGEAFILHSSDYRTSDTVLLEDGVALSTSLDVLRDIAEGRGPKHSLFALGYAGWGEGQLETELAQGAWEVVPADEALLFDQQVETKWQRAQDSRGRDL